MDSLDSFDSLAPFDILELAKRKVHSVLKIALDNLHLYEQDVCRTDDDGRTLLHILAEQRGSLPLVKKLLEKARDGRLVLAVDREGKTAFHAAAEGGGDPEVIGLLLRRGARLDAVDVAGETALFKATRQGHLGFVKFCCSQGGVGEVFRAKNRLGENVLHVAAEGGHLQVIGEIFKAASTRGIEINAIDVCGRTPLCAAVEGGFADVVRYLIKKGANVNIASARKRSPLQIAVARNEIDVARLLLMAGAKINHKDRNGVTALHLAIAVKSEEVLNLLLGHGANLDLADEDGYTALHVAANFPELSSRNVDLLIRKGANLERRTLTNAETALHRAASTGNLFAVNILATAGCDLLAKNADCRSAIDLAEENGHFGVVRFLREAQGKLGKVGGEKRGRIFAWSNSGGRTKIPVRRSKSLSTFHKSLS